MDGKRTCGVCGYYTLYPHPIECPNCAIHDMSRLIGFVDIDLKACRRELSSRIKALANLQGRYNELKRENDRLRSVEIGPRAPTGNTVIDGRDDWEKNPK